MANCRNNDDIGRICSSFPRKSSCTDCGKNLTSESRSNSPEKCSCQSVLQQHSPCSPHLKEETESNQQRQILHTNVNKDLYKKGEGKVNQDSTKQTFWQWLFSLIGLDKKVKKDADDRNKPNFILSKDEKSKETTEKNQLTLLEADKDLGTESKDKDSTKSKKEDESLLQNKSPSNVVKEESKPKEATEKDSSNDKHKKSKRIRSKSPDAKSRNKYLGKPLETITTQKTNTDKRQQPGRKVTIEEAEKNTEVPEPKRPPISIITSSAKYLVPYNFDCPFPNETGENNLKKLSQSKRKDTKNSSSPSLSPINMCEPACSCNCSPITCSCKLCPSPNPCCETSITSLMRQRGSTNEKNTCQVVVSPFPISDLTRELARTKAKLCKAKKAACSKGKKGKCSKKKKSVKCSDEETDDDMCPTPCLCCPPSCPPPCPLPCSPPCPTFCPLPKCQPCSSPCPPLCPPPCPPLCPPPCPPACPRPCPPACPPPCSPPCCATCPTICCSTCPKPPTCTLSCSRCLPPPIPCCTPSKPCPPISSCCSILPKRTLSCGSKSPCSKSSSPRCRTSHSPAFRRKCGSPRNSTKGKRACSSPCQIIQQEPKKCGECPITCMRPCCVPSVNLTGKCPPMKPNCPPASTPCPQEQGPSSGAHSLTLPISTFCNPSSIKSYVKSKNSDAYCKYLMARYNVAAPEYQQPCPLSIKSCSEKIAILTQAKDMQCGRCEGNSYGIAGSSNMTVGERNHISTGCSNHSTGNTINHSSEKKESNQTQNYQKSTSPAAKFKREHVAFNTSPCKTEPYMSISLSKRTPVECIREPGPRSPTKEYMSKLGLPKKMRSPKKESAEAAETCPEPQTTQKSKSPKRKTRASKIETEKSGEKEAEPQNVAEQNTSENKASSSGKNGGQKSENGKSTEQKNNRSEEAGTRRRPRSRSREPIVSRWPVTNKGGAKTYCGYSPSHSSFYRNFLCLSPNSHTSGERAQVCNFIDDTDANLTCSSVSSITCIKNSQSFESKPDSLLNIESILSRPDHCLTSEKPERSTFYATKIFSVFDEETNKSPHEQRLNFSPAQKLNLSPTCSPECSMNASDYERTSQLSNKLPNASPIEKLLNDNDFDKASSSQTEVDESNPPPGGYTKKYYEDDSLQDALSPISSTRRSRPMIVEQSRRRSRSISPSTTRCGNSGDRLVFSSQQSSKSPKRRCRSKSPSNIKTTLSSRRLDDLAEKNEGNLELVEDDRNGEKKENLGYEIMSNCDNNEPLPIISETNTLLSKYQRVVGGETEEENISNEFLPLSSEENVEHFTLFGNIIENTETCDTSTNTLMKNRIGDKEFVPTIISNPNHSDALFDCPQGESSVDPKNYNTVGESCVDPIDLSSSGKMASFCRLRESCVDKMPASIASPDLCKFSDSYSGIFDKVPESDIFKKQTNIAASPGNKGKNRKFCGLQECDGNKQSNNSNAGDLPSEDSDQTRCTEEHVIITENDTVVDRLEISEKEINKETPIEVGNEIDTTIALDNTLSSEKEGNETFVNGEETDKATETDGLDNVLNPVQCNFEKPSQLHEILKNSGVVWQKVGPATPADIKILNLAKVAFRNVPCDQQLLKEGQEPKEGDNAKPFLGLLKSTDDNSEPDHLSGQFLKTSEEGGSSILSRLKDLD